MHAPGIAGHPRAELVGVWGRDPEKAARLAAEYGADSFSDVDELIASVDAVAFAVPPDLQAELAVRAAEAGRSLLLEQADSRWRSTRPNGWFRPLRAPTVVFFTRRFDPGTRRWFATAVDGHAWEGASMLYLASIFEPGSPYAHSEWRRERGALWDLGPHALALLIPTLGRVDSVAAVRGRGDKVHLALRHATGAAINVTLRPDLAAWSMTDLLLWGSEGSRSVARRTTTSSPLMPPRSTR